MKNEKGITLLVLSITIIVMLIIAMTTINTSIDLYKTATTNNFIAKMKVIQEKVNTIKANYKNWEPESGEKNINNYCAQLNFSSAGSCVYKDEFVEILDRLNNTEGITSWSNGDENIDNYFYFGPSDLENKLGIKDIDNMYVIINFNTGNVVEKNGIESSKENETEKIHRQYDCKSGDQLIYETLKEGNIQLDVSVVENNGLNQKIKLEMVAAKDDGTILADTVIPDIHKVYYKYAENISDLNASDNWLSASNLKEFKIMSKTVTFNIDVSGIYEFKILDINKNEYKMQAGTNTNITLCNPPVLLKGMSPIIFANDGTISAIGNTNSPNWYNYSIEEKKMANAITSDGSIWVWIPRIGYTENTVTGKIEYGYVSGISKASTYNNKMFKNILETFSNNGEITGFWIAKYAATFDENGMLVMECSSNQFDKTTITDAKKNCEDKVDEKVRDYSHLMTVKEKDAILTITKLFGYEDIESLDNVQNTSIYPANTDFVSNTFQSITQNIYGVYDLFAEESELLDGVTDAGQNGRYRAVISFSEEAQKQIKVGDYVKYNVPYTDMYTSHEFSETTGWRYLGLDAFGNKLIISTGIPAKLYYHYNSNEGNAANGWWGTDAEVTAMFGTEYSANGYDYDNGGYSNRYAAVGLLKHFESIPYTTSTSNPSIPNTMTGTVAGNGTEGPLGATLGTAFRANEVSSKIVDVHNLSLEELNTALNRTETSAGSISSDTTGMFYLRGLNDYGYTSDSQPYYWFATPYDRYFSHLQYVNYSGFYGNYDSSTSTLGIRTVVTLDSTIELLDSNRDGIFEIK